MMHISYETISRYLSDHDGEMVHEWADDYGERGYHCHTSVPDDQATPMVLLGDWWLRTSARGYGDNDTHPERGHMTRSYGEGDRATTLRGWSDRYPRLSAQLEAQGVQFEWYDEWTVSYDGGSKAWRTSGDSYSWEPATAYHDGELITPDDDIDTWIDYAANNEDVAITSANVGRSVGAALEDAGFTQYAPGNPHEYSNGWHPGQTDTPRQVVEQINREYHDIDIVFAITEVSQFYLNFAAFIRPQATGTQLGDCFVDYADDDEDDID